MGTATFRTASRTTRRAVARRSGAYALGLAAIVIAIAVAVAGCGGRQPRTSASVGTSGPETNTSAQGQSTAGPAEGAFGWLHPRSPPAGWQTARIPIGAAMPYPPGWTLLKGDAGTATVALLDQDHHFVGYLNLTPRQSTETMANWSHFRVAHNAHERERDIKMLAVGTGLRFRGGRGSCVRDSYTTTTGTRYIELACLVTGQQASVVIVGASPPQTWGRVSALLEQAISSVTA